MHRRQARALAFELLYEYSFHKDEEPKPFYENALCGRDSEGDDYTWRLFAGVVQNEARLTELVAAHSQNWSIDRMSRVSSTILRLAAYEMCLDDVVETPIAINEAVELSKHYEGEDAFTFINGVLGGLARSKESGAV